MEINNLLILIENSIIGPLDKITLLGAIQELAQYRDNPLLQMQPCWKYVRQNDINMQNEHVAGECLEADGAVTLADISLEWFDILQGAITGLFILKIKYGVDLNKLIQIGIDKNTNRVGGSYYG